MFEYLVREGRREDVEAAASRKDLVEEVLKRANEH